MTEPSTSFLHPALPVGVDAIRVLTLQPGDYLSPLVGELTPVAFSKKPKYVALSYTWASSYPDNENLPVSLSDSRSPGTSPNRLRIERRERRSSSVGQPTSEHLSLPSESSPPPTTKKTCNGIMLNGHPFPIGHNLHLALLHLRSPTHSISIWADAVCINQADNEERNSQVSLMAFIYTRAARVVAWLGTKYYPPTTGLFRSMALEWKAGQSQHLAASLLGKVKMRSSPEPDKNTFARIVYSRYWKRLWIVQELCLPRILVLMYGPDIWTYEEFRECHKVPDHHPEMRMLFETRDERHTDIMKLESLIERFAKSECSELRDRIYGLLGCANDVRPVAADNKGIDPLRAHIDALSSEKVTSTKAKRVMGSLGVEYHCSFYDIWTSVVGFVYFQAGNLEQNSSFQMVADALKDLARQQEVFDPQIEERQFSIVRTAGIVQAALGQKVEESLVEKKESMLMHGVINLALAPPNYAQAGREHPIFSTVGYMAGEILQIGPDYGSLVGSSSAVLDWTGCWVDHYQKPEDLEKLRSINEDYLAKVLDYEQADLARIRNIYNRHVLAQRLTGPIRYNPEYLSMNRRAAEYEVLQASMGGKDQAPRICLGTGYFIGFVPSAAIVGDVIVRFWNCSAAIVLRPLRNFTPRTSFMLVGRADVARSSDNTVSKAPSSESSLPLWTSDVRVGSGKDSQPSGALRIDLDLQTLQEITAYIST